MLHDHFHVAVERLVIRDFIVESQELIVDHISYDQSLLSCE